MGLRNGDVAPQGWTETFTVRYGKREKGGKTLRNKRALSPLLATIILIAIVVSTGIVVYGMISGWIAKFSPSIELQLSSVDFVKAGDKSLLSVTVKNVGTTPVFVVVGSSAVSDGLSSIDAMPKGGPDPGVGVTFYTVVYLPAGSYTLQGWAGDGGDLFVRGPGYSGWVGLGGSFSVADQKWATFTINSQGGVYEIVFHAIDSYGPNEGARLQGTLHGRTVRWVILVWNARGESTNYGVVKSNPIDPIKWNVKVYGGLYVETGASFNFDILWGDGNASGDVQKTGDEGLILGVVEPGSTVSRTWLIASGEYGVPGAVIGNKYSLTVKAFDLEGGSWSKAFTITCNG